MQCCLLEGIRDKDEGITGPLKRHDNIAFRLRMLISMVIETGMRENTGGHHF